MSNKKRHPLRKNWSNLRTNIEKARLELSVDSEEFTELRIHEWELVAQNINAAFLYDRPQNTKRSWLWNDLKVAQYSIPCPYDPYEKLILLVDNNELVYFLVNETINGATKYWYYKGKIQAIISIIGETEGLDEYYITSMKYEWFLTVDHHDVLVGTGDMIPVMKANEEKFKEKFQKK